MSDRFNHSNEIDRAEQHIDAANGDERFEGYSDWQRAEAALQIELAKAKALERIADTLEAMRVDGINANVHH